MTEPEPLQGDLTAADFPAFFHVLWDKTPFPWQTALAQRVLSDRPYPWPEAITLPTAAGKTACLDIALFALSAQAHRQDGGKPLAAPRRLFIVVDRRVIVDEAYERAQCMATRLDLAQTGILKTVADRLRRLAGGTGEPPLACFQLRGGTYRDDAWARSPIQPTIVCSTVDQLGSRLLFRAYGRSFRAWHLQAGLVANDSLILLDEAHCAQPFRQTLASVARYRGWAERPLTSPFHFVEMTATPPAGVSTFPDQETGARDRAHPVLKQRLEAAKPCRLVVADKAQGRETPPKRIRPWHRSSRTRSMPWWRPPSPRHPETTSLVPPAPPPPSSSATASIQPAVPRPCSRNGMTRGPSCSPGACGPWTRRTPSPGPWPSWAPKGPRTAALRSRPLWWPPRPWRSVPASTSTSW